MCIWIVSILHYPLQDGDTPLHLCAEHGDKKIAKLILESGQAYEASLNNVSRFFHIRLKLQDRILLTPRTNYETTGVIPRRVKSILKYVISRDTCKWYN